MLDRLRQAFPLVIAVVLPLVGVLLAANEYSRGDRAGALRIALATLLGVFVYALVLL